MIPTKLRRAVSSGKLRESYREGGKVRKRTLANLSKWPDDPVRGFRILLKGGVAVKSVDDVFEILRSRRHGHGAAVMVRRQVARPFGHRAPRRPSSVWHRPVAYSILLDGCVRYSEQP